MELIREIYKEIIENSKFMEKAENVVMKEIEEITLLQKETMESEKYENLRDLLFQISATAQEEAFIVGMKYGVTVLTQCFTHNEFKEFL